MTVDQAIIYLGLLTMVVIVAFAVERTNRRINKLRRRIRAIERGIGGEPEGSRHIGF